MRWDRIGRLDAHHIIHWVRGDRADLDNLVSLCHFHHRRLHDDAFRIRSDKDAGLVFETADGERILRPLRTVCQPRGAAEALRTAGAADGSGSIDSDAAAVKDGSAQMDLGYIVEVLVDGVRRARHRASERAAPSPEADLAAQRHS